MNNSFGIKNIRTGEDVERAWRMTRFDDQIGDPMHMYQSDNTQGTIDENADVIFQIARSEMNILIAQDVTCVYAQRSQEEVQTEIDNTVVNMLQLVNSARKTKS